MLPEIQRGGAGHTTLNALAQADKRGPELANLLEVKRWMPVVVLKQGKRSVGGLFYGRRKRLITRPEVGCGVVIHSFVDLPAR